MSKFKVFSRFLGSINQVQSEPSNRDQFEVVKRYQSKKPKAKPRTIDTQVRDWLYDQGLTEVLSKDHLTSYWTLNGQILFIVIGGGCACTVRLTNISYEELLKSGLFDELSQSFQFTTGVDLHLLKPLLRLAISGSRSNDCGWGSWDDIDLINDRLCGRYTDYFMFLLGPDVLLNDD